MSAPAPTTGVRMEVRTEAGFKCHLTHGPSGSVITTEPPKDNGGTGMHFSPTDLLGVSLLACALTTMALTASREGIPFGEATGSVEKRMTQAPRRVGALLMRIRMPAGLDVTQRARLEEAARGCPVARSLSPDVEAPMTFEYA